MVRICTATCPTYVLLGDERDGPRGRIVMMQQMLEESATPSAETVLHVDRCLSCLACRTACPSSVDYARLVDTARVHIETRYRRPLADRILRSLHWPIQYQFHLSDFVDYTHPDLADQVPAPGDGVYVPQALRVPLASRLELFDRAMDLMARDYSFVTLDEWARTV